MWVAVLIFGATYLAMAGAPLPGLRVDRPTAALCGAVAMVLAGVISLDEALAAVDLDVVTLLLGMMIVAAHLQRASFFRYAAWMVVTHARSPVALLWALVFVSGGLSALLLNDTICLMFTPLVVAVVAETTLPAWPYLIALASATNIGGVVTFTGNPQNMIVGTAAAGDPDYLEYLLHALPIGVACLAVNAALIAWMFRRELAAARLGVRDTPRPYLDRRLTAKAGLALGGFVVAAIAGASIAGAAITAAAVLILVARVPSSETFARIDWSLLLFFAGLFVVVHAFAGSGAFTATVESLRPALASPGLSADATFIG